MNIHQSNDLYYENVEFQLATGSTNYQVSTNLGTSQTGTFGGYFGMSNSLLGRFATEVVIRTNQTITVKLNSTSNDNITIASTDSPYTILGIKITDIYISNNSGSTATIKLLLKDNPN
jgi:hypothetical protein